MFPVTLSQSPIKRVAINAPLTGVNEIVAAVSGKKIRVLGGVVAVATAVGLRFRSATTDLMGHTALPATSQLDINWTPWGALETNVGEALNLTASTTTVIGGFLTYQEIGG